MLRELRIKNFTIINDLSIDFQTGLNVLTGETGAGKSIIVDAIGLLLGDKASQDMIKTGKKEAYIEAYFDNNDGSLLKDLSIDSDDGIILRRGISLQGKSRAYINDAPVSVQTLSDIGSALIDIHGQNMHQGLLKKESHLQFLDTMGSLSAEAGSLKSLYGELVALRNEVTGMKARISERTHRIEFLRFQINEILSAALQPGEKGAIEEERSILLNLNRLKESSETAYMLLYESEGSCLERLAAVVSKIRDMAAIDRSAEQLLASLETAVPIIEDSALSLRGFKDRYDVDPRRLDALDERLELIKRLEKKYGTEVDGILAHLSVAGKELEDLEHMDERMGDLEAGLKAKEKEVISGAEQLSLKRQAIAKKVEEMATSELKGLGFQKAAFRVGLRKRETVGENGMDDVEFLFSANPGEPPKPLIKVASGGELSRIMLALKCIEIGRKKPFSAQQTVDTKESPIRSHNLSPATLIFDEVDAGIGGVTAQHVGTKLKSIAGNYQVFCITHLAQIAALADNHMKVDKSTGRDSVEVTVEALTGEKRQSELARMLSGTVTDSSLKHAQELLNIGNGSR